MARIRVGVTAQFEGRRAPPARGPRLGAHNSGPTARDNKGVELLLQVVVWPDIAVEFELCR